MLPEVRPSTALHAVVVAAALSAAAAFQSAVLADHGPLTFAGWWLATAVVTVLTTLWCRRRLSALHGTPAVAPFILALFVLPFVAEGLRRWVDQPTNPLEVVLITGVLLTALGLSAVSGIATHQPLAMTCSLFVTLFAASLSASIATCLCAAAFAIAGTVWLTMRHWNSIATPTAKRHQRRYPLRMVAISFVVLLCPLVAVGVTAPERLWALSGWMPSSGGSDGYDPTARNGVGDGTALVAGQDNIQSFGPIEDAPFRSGDEPSLYDLFDDSYDEPVKTQKQDRALALPPNIVNAAETQMAKSKQASKEFSTLRKADRGTRQNMRDLGSTALFYLKGRTPLHLRHEVFDLYDGLNWYPIEKESEPQPTLGMQSVAGRPWLQLQRSASAMEYFAGIEDHAIKVVHLRTNRLPTPPHLTGIHIDQLADATYFASEPGDLVRMERENLPELTAIHYRSRGVDARLLPDQSYWGEWRDERCYALPQGPEMDRIAELAKSWTADVRRGWPEIQAIVQRLRTEYVLDREWKAPEDSVCPVADFLFESRRGPDYQFATAAAVMLRSLGYSTRLVGGFYASPERYERQHQHTPIVAADTHIWLEIFQMGQVWLTVEPSPGYEVLQPPPTWWEQTQATAAAVGRWLLRQWPSLLVFIGVVGCLYWQRRRWLDGLCLLYWRWLPSRSERGRVLQTLRAIDYRLRLRDLRRPAGSSPAAWYRQLSLNQSDAAKALVQLCELGDWAAFAPAAVAPPQRGAASCRDVCREAMASLRVVPARR